MKWLKEFIESCPERYPDLPLIVSIISVIVSLMALIVRLLR